MGEPLAGCCSPSLPRFERFLALAELHLLLFLRFFSDLSASELSDTHCHAPRPMRGLPEARMG